MKFAMPDTPARKVTVFVSSPKDVAPERGRVQAVAAKLNREHEGLVHFETVLWEEHFYTADKSFQPQIPEAVASDVVVSIFWTRIGTELPADFPRMANGKSYPSGTAYELLTALEASKAKGVPDVYVFRKIADGTLPMDAERRRQAQTQLDALEAFWNEWFRSQTGEFKAAFQNFTSTDAFEQQLELLLRQWLEARGLLGPRIAWPKEKGSPFPGLAPFEAEHAAVFFGRDRMIDEARRRLAAAAERATPFLLVVGASGSGKSSLARAGLIPRLTTPGVVAAVDLWRVVRMKPGEDQAGPLMALATALLARGALPELAQGDYPTAISLADNLRRGGSASVQPIVSALARAAEAGQRERHADQAPKTALVLLLDQLEELFAQRVTDAERAAFADSLRQLVATGRVWVVATLRADLYELLLKQPALKALKETGTSLDLGPPGPAELAEIVRAPAAAAALVFETDPKKGELSERLLADARTAESLPLLQFTLRQLYERREEIAGETTLTHAAYDQLGGLAGAIAAEAERAVCSLPPEAVAALPRLLRRLAEPARDGKSLTLREVLHTDAARDASESTLVDALLTARILIARTDAGGRPTVRLAHDAVLASWPRASAAAQASRDFYRVRAEVEDTLRRWQEHGRPKDRLIQPGVPLAEAEKLVRDFGAELPVELTSFVTASRNRARLRQRLVAAAAISFFILTVTAALIGWWAVTQRDRAEQALTTITRTGNMLVYDLGTEFSAHGLPSDALGRMLDRVIQGYDEVVRLDPKNPIGYASRGVAYNSKGDIDRAFAEFNEAIRIDPKNAVGYLTRGAAYNSKGERDRAIQDYDKAIGLDPKNVFAYAARGELYKNNKEYNRAIQDYDQAIQLEPPPPLEINAYINRGSAYASVGEHDRAIKDYDRAIELDPKNASAYTNRADAYNNKGERDRAIRDYDRAIELDPKNAISYASRGLVYNTMGDVDRAIQDYEQAIQLDPKFVLAYAARGLAYTLKGDDDRAMQDYNQAIQLDPKNAVAYLNRGLGYARKKDYDRAIQDYDLALQLDPKNALSYLNRADAYKSKRDYDPAIEDYDQSIQLNPKNALFHLGRGDAYESKGEHDRAIQDYDEAIQLDPKNAAAYVSRGDAYEGKRDYGRALQDYDQAIQFEPMNAGAHSGRGRAYFYQSNFTVAAAAFSRANEIEDDAYSVIWRYIARERGGENGTAELAAEAARLKREEWPYPLVELYLAARSPAEVLSLAGKPDERCEAEFYTGEWHLLRGDRAAAATHVQAAADICPKDIMEYKAALAELQGLKR
jgi:tetratricopeptide (TPR) repeat protein